jgi:integrase
MIFFASLTFKPIYKGKINNIIDFLVLNNYPVSQETKIKYISSLEKTKNLSKSYKSQYNAAFNILLENFSYCFIDSENVNDVIDIIVQDFINKTNTNDKSKKRYTTSLHRYYSEFAEINATNIKKFLDNIEVSQNTKKQYLRDIKSFASYLYDYDNINKNTYVEIKNIKINGFELNKKDILTENEIEELISISPDQYKLCISLCYYGALRFFETNKYNVNSNYLEVSGKGNKTMTVAISKSLDNILTNNNIENMPSYNNFSKWLNNECKTRYNKNITTHCLRASRAIHLYQKTKDIELVKRHLRHKKIDTTSGYLRHIEDSKYLDIIRS